MFSTTPFNIHANEYDQWFEKHKQVFESELDAIKLFLPTGKVNGIEVGLASGRFATALGITEGVEPSSELRKKALLKGIDVKDAIAEKLPYKNDAYNLVIMTGCVNYLTDVLLAFKEANRVLKENGTIIIGFVDRNSVIGKEYEAKKNNSVFYKLATFYTPQELTDKLKLAGFGDFKFSQTLFKDLNEIKIKESPVEGFGKGSFVVIKAVKNSKLINL